MPNRNPSHRGPYKATPPAPIPAGMPVLLSRALAQLRGDPPASWPNVQRPEPPEVGAPYSAELYGPHYPFPTMERLIPHLHDPNTRAELHVMLKRLQKASIGTAWRVLEARCAKTTPVLKDPGFDVLLALTEALVPMNVVDQVTVRQSAKRIKAAARELVLALEAFKDMGTPIFTIMPRRPLELPGIEDVVYRVNLLVGMLASKPPKPPKPPKLSAFAELLDLPPVPSEIINYTLTDPTVLLTLLRDLAEREIGTVPQRRGTTAQRRAMTIARRLTRLAGAATAVAIASAATGATVTAKALSKRN